MSKGKKKKTPPSHIPVSKADVDRAKKTASDEAVSLAMVIFLTVLLDKEGYDKDGLSRVWKFVEELSDSIVKKYVSVYDLRKVLRDEYGIAL